MELRIEEINTLLTDREARIAELEAKFSQPGQFDGPAQLALAGQQYAVLKEQAGSLWEEWERLSAEAEGTAGRLAELETC